MAPPADRTPSRIRPLAVVLVLAPLAIGGTRPAIQVALSAAVAFSVLWFAARRGQSWRTPRWAWPPIALALWGAGQCVPLPPFIWETLTPMAVGLRGGWGAVSLDPPATIVATLHQAAFALVVVAAANSDRRDRRRLIDAIVLATAAVAGLGLYHWASGADRIFGLIGALDRAALSGFFTSFVNPNTTAGFLVLGASVALGVAVGDRSEAARRRAMAVGLLAAGGVALSGSRGGIIALGLAAAVFGGLALTRSQALDDRHRIRRVAGLAVLGVVFAALGSWVLLPDWGADPMADGRSIIWREASALIGQSWPVGIGRGAFGAVFPLVQSTPFDGTVTHPENIGLQLVIEWGIVGGAVALVGGLGGWWWALRRDGRRPRPVTWGLLAGLAGVGVQQAVDFGFEAMGLSLAVAAALGLLLGRGEPRESRRGHRLYLAGAVAVVVAAALPGRWAVSNRADADALRLAEVSPGALEASIDEAMARHPADGLIPLAAASRMATLGGDVGPVLRRINQAMVRMPADARPHLFVARLLRETRPAQAAGAYRMAIERAPWRSLSLIREASTLVDPLHLAMAVPADEVAWGRLGEVLLETRPAVARAVMEGLLFVDDGRVAPHRIRGRACLAGGDRACVEAEARWLLSHGMPVAGHALHARWALAEGRIDDASSSAAAALDAEPGAPGARRLAAEVAGAAGDLETARTHYDALWRQVGGREGEAAAVLAAWGRLERARGDRARGQRLLEQAARLDARYAPEAARVADDLDGER